MKDIEFVDLETMKLIEYDGEYDFVYKKHLVTKEWFMERWVGIKPNWHWHPAPLLQQIVRWFDSQDIIISGDSINGYQILYQADSIGDGDYAFENIQEAIRKAVEILKEQSK